MIGLNSYKWKRNIYNYISKLGLIKADWATHCNYAGSEYKFRDGKNGKKIMQLKCPKYQKPKDENMGWTKHSS